MRNIFACIALIVFYASPISAQMLVAPQYLGREGAVDLGAALAISEVEYDFDGGGDRDIERTILGGSVAYGISPEFDLYGELGLIFDSELERSNDDGDGFLLGGGVRGLIVQEGQFKLLGLAGLRIILEDYGSGTDGQLFELPLALIGRFEAGNNIGLYAGLDVIPFSDGEVEFGNGADTDFDRDSPIGLRLGADIALKPVVLNAEVAVVSEQTFMLRAIFPL